MNVIETEAYIDIFLGRSNMTKRCWQDEIYEDWKFEENVRKNEV